VALDSREHTPEALNKALELERKARLNAEDELHKLIKH